MDFRDFVLKNNGIINIKVIPKSSRSGITVDDDTVKIKVVEVPENNKANEAVINLIHKTLKVPKSNIKILSGKSNSNKKIEIKI
ncbi:MAG: DUF167 domain-containing protein [Rickettsiales bacterium]|nr:DUF167 domain-containing protein [Rickettsiales bacterium]